MAKFLTVIRKEYAIQLLKEMNPSEAKMYCMLFDSVAEFCPVQSDINAEREIMAGLDVKAD